MIINPIICENCGEELQPENCGVEIEPITNHILRVCGFCGNKVDVEEMEK